MCATPLTSLLVVGATPAVVSTAGTLDTLNLFGFLAAGGALCCFAHRRESRAMRVLLAAFVAALAAYSFAVGAWPVSLAEAGWALVAVRRCFATAGEPARPEATAARRSAFAADNRAISPRRNLAVAESRFQRLFGMN